jgi:hypothetical protein
MTASALARPILMIALAAACQAAESRPIAVFR